MVFAISVIVDIIVVKKVVIIVVENVVEIVVIKSLPIKSGIDRNSKEQ